MKLLSIIFFSAALVFMIFGCETNKKESNSPETKNKMEKVFLDSLSIELDSSISWSKIGQTWYFEDEARKMTRNPRSFSLSGKGDFDSSFEFVAKRGAKTIEYNLEEKHAGSSGSEQLLIGVLRFKNREEVFGVEGWAIGNQPDATWCLPYLLSVEFESP